MLEVGGDRDCGVGTSDRRHKRAASKTHTKGNGDATGTNRNTLDGSTGSQHQTPPRGVAGTRVASRIRYDDHVTKTGKTPISEAQNPEWMATVGSILSEIHATNRDSHSRTREARPSNSSQTKDTKSANTLPRNAKSPSMVNRMADEERH
jgi:hypothetical protein